MHSCFVFVMYSHPMTTRVMRQTPSGNPGITWHSLEVGPIFRKCYRPTRFAGVSPLVPRNIRSRSCAVFNPDPGLFRRGEKRAGLHTAGWPPKRNPSDSLSSLWSDWPNRSH